MNCIRQALGVALLIFSQGGLDAAEPATWRITRVETAPLIDGELEESFWAGVPAITEFRQVEPVTGGEPSVLTEVHLAYDAQRLYFAVVAHDGDPSSIVATQRKRDADLTSDDRITVVIDSFLDKRNGYYFSFNPLGARQDALIRGGSILNTDWDGIWDVSTRFTDSGWVAEGSVPLSTISFKNDLPAWGLNIERNIARSGERMRWHGIERQYDVSNLANSGRLVGLTDLKRAAGYEARPFSTLTYRRDRIGGTETTRFKPGFDLFYKLTESSTAVLTVNTDFADAEVDDRVVNLTRFPVTFPEKRAFFLQDAGVFSYSLINNNPLPYYSRRIGLGRQGEIVDIVAGARVSGREGPVNFGVLGVRTESSGSIEAKDLAVARVLVNLSDEASVGVISTYGDPRSNGNAWLIGTDLNYTTGHLFGRTATLLDGSLYFQRTDSTGREGDSDAFGWGLKYDSPTWGFVSYLDRVGEDYFPAMGSVRQTGVTTATAKFDYEFNPPNLKRVVPVLSYVQRTSEIHDIMELQTLGPEITFETKRGDILLLRLRGEREILPESFLVGNGVVVTPGEFEDARIEASITMSKSRPLSTTLGVAKIPYYGGEQMAYTSLFTWRPSPMFNFDATFNYTGVKLPYASFPVRLVKLGGAVQFSETLVWSLIGQYDNLSSSVGFNTRVRWSYAPGSDMFFVVNQGADTSGDRWEYTRTEVSAKVGATFRF